MTGVSATVSLRKLVREAVREFIKLRGSPVTICEKGEDPGSFSLTWERWTSVSARLDVSIEGDRVDAELSVIGEEACSAIEWKSFRQWTALLRVQLGELFPGLLQYSKEDIKGLKFAIFTPSQISIVNRLVMRFGRRPNELAQKEGVIRVRYDTVTFLVRTDGNYSQEIV